MKKLLWLDDQRNPFKDNWVRDYSPVGVDCEITWIKTYRDFVYHITEYGLPNAICFDHDIENFHANKSTFKEYTGYDCAKWLVDYCLDGDLDLPLFSIQSSNPAGKENIKSILNNYNKFRNEKNN